VDRPKWTTLNNRKKKYLLTVKKLEMRARSCPISVTSRRSALCCPPAPTFRHPGAGMYLYLCMYISEPLPSFLTRMSRETLREPQPDAPVGCVRTRMKAVGFGVQQSLTSPKW
jgi:hypothetical protein